MLRNTVTVLLTLALAAPVCLAADTAATAAAATVELHESACVEADQVLLADLATIAPEERAEQLGALVVGPAPLPGDSRRLTAGYLKMRLRRNGVSCDRVAVTGAKAVEVRRALPPPAVRREAQGEVEAADPSGARHPVRPAHPVKRGARLRLRVICGAVVIGAEATLLEDAVVGGRAKMRVEQTRETVVAQIVQPSEAVMRRE